METTGGEERETDEREGTLGPFSMASIRLGKGESMVRDRLSALKVRSIAFTKLLHLMATLSGSLRRRSVGTLEVNVVGDLLPVGGGEVASAKGVPFVSVGERMSVMLRVFQLALRESNPSKIV